MPATKSLPGTDIEFARIAWNRDRVVYLIDRHGRYVTNANECFGILAFGSREAALRKDLRHARELISLLARYGHELRVLEAY